MAQRSPYGSWRSPQTAQHAIAAGIGIGETAFDGEATLWLESRPSEGGRNVVVRRTADGHIEDLIAAPFNARTRVHEYGGGAWVMCAAVGGTVRHPRGAGGVEEAAASRHAAASGTLYFSNFADQRVYRVDPGSAPRAITPEAELRYADYCPDPARGLLWCVREDHRGAGEAVNCLVALRCDGDGEGGRIVADGADFFAAPRLSPDGTQLAWLRWNHPDMPYFGCELWLANVSAEGGLHGARCIAGSRDESVQQPCWSDEGELLFLGDRSGWLNLYRWHDGQVHALCPMAADFGEPQWVFGNHTFAFAAPRRVVCGFTTRAVSQLASLDLDSLRFEPVATPFSHFTGLSARAGQLLFCGASPLHHTSVCRLELGGGRLDVLREGSAIAVDADYTSIAEAIEFPTAGGAVAHAFFYRPQNRDFEAAVDDRPPLLVLSHGGPTSMTTNAYKAGIQYWTSRGFAVVDVNYRGSTGFGRAYMLQLDGQWGVADVDDCIHAAHHLVQRGDVDGRRLAIRGGSAGGYTTLCALAFHRVFHSGCSRYGIGDLEALVKDTHKFESRYLDRLIGPWPEARALYEQRSPIHHLDGLNCPLILFQGSDDKAVPPEQSRQMHAAVKAKGLPVAYIEFEGEQHGFRQAKNIVRALEAEAWFHARIFGIELAEAIAPVAVDNPPR